MRSTAHLHGHPIHPTLIPFPFAYLLGSAGMNLLASATGRTRLHRTASHLNAMGLASGLLAAVPGIVDYLFAVPPKSSAHDRATRHAVANVTALSLFAAARTGRRGPDAPASAWAVAAEVCGAGLLGYAGWLGGTLVYRNQIGVDHRYANAGKWQVERAASSIETGTVDVGPSDGLEVDQMRLVHVGDRRIVVARTADGWAACDDRCTHKGGPLSDGALVAGRVQCPWHGSQFDVTSGAVVRGPAEAAIATYPIAARDGRLYLTVP